MTALPASGGWQPQLLQAGVLPMEAHLLAPDGGLDADMVDVPSNVLLLRGGAGVVLVDAGSGPYVTDWPGGSDDLIGAMAAAGCAPQDVDLVVLTHLDFDHAGGCLQLPRARVAAPAGAVPAGHSGRAGEEVTARLESEGRLDRVEDGGQAAPGIRLRAAPGHREGHSVAEIGVHLVHLADVVHHQQHIAHPSWDRAFDSDPETALVTRLRVLEQVARSGVTVTASHIAGAATIERAPDGALRWQPR